MAVAPPGVAEPTPPVAPLRSLLTSARVLEGAAADNGVDGDWRKGFVIQPENCIEPNIVDDQCMGLWDGEGADPGDKPAPDDLPDHIAVLPFEIELALRCGTFGWESIDWRDKVRRQVEATTAKGVEMGLWSGGGNLDRRYLRNTATDITPTPGTAVAPDDALALLSQAVADCGDGGRGMIHATVRTVEKWMPTGALQLERGPAGVDVLVTKSRGDFVVAGSGYDGSGPVNGAGVPQNPPGTDEAYAYATRMVTVRLDGVEVLNDTHWLATDPTTGRRINYVTVYGERLAAVSFECCVSAVLVDLS